MGLEINFLDSYRLTLLPERAIYWLQEEALILSDLHLGKASFFRQHGMPLPNGVENADFEIIGRLCKRLAIRRLIIVGDFIHHRQGINQEMLCLLSDFQRQFQLEWHLVCGNHDRDFLKIKWPIPIEFYKDQLHINGLNFVHDIQNSPCKNVIAGHLHPMFRIANRLDRIRVPCFYQIREDILILPSFTSFSGGQNISLKPRQKVFPIVHDQVIDISSLSIRDN